MRISIATRIFLALTLVSLVILTLNAAVTRWNFERGFLQYVADQEAATIADAAVELAEIYALEGNWSALRDNRRRWDEILRASSDTPPPEQRPARGPEGRPGHRPPPPDPLELGRRIALLDAEGELIVGLPQGRNEGQSVPVIENETTVGYVVIAPRRQLTDQVDQNFAKEQERSIYLIGVAALLFAALISAILARQLTQPIRALAAGARSIISGDFQTRISADANNELGDLARDFNQLAATLDRSRESRQRWVADIAHELRTPLSVLRGELDAIEDGIRTFDAGTRKSLQAEVARLNQLVGDLHDLSVYDEGGLDCRRNNVELIELLRIRLANAAHRLADAGITLTTELPGQPVVIFADAARLEQLFANLIENTVRYTDAPGSLRVSCAVDSDAAILEFADSEPGVPEDALDKLFDRLFRLDASRSRATGGSGLGLSICRAIVDAHSGTLEALTSETGGLLIRVGLPLAAPGRN